MKKIITITLIAAIAATSAAALTACGSADKADPTTDVTTAPTVAATQAAATTAAQSVQQSGGQTGEQAENNSTGANSQSEEYAGITREQAISSALSYYADGTEVIEVYQGTYPEQGWDAWVVTVHDSYENNHTYYCGYAFCIPADVRTSEYDGPAVQDFTEEQAIAAVEQRIGDFSHIVSVEEGATPDGMDCYVITVENMDGSQTIYYSGFLFCYPAE